MWQWPKECVSKSKYDSQESWQSRFNKEQQSRIIQLELQLANMADKYLMLLDYLNLKVQYPPVDVKPKLVKKNADTN